MVVAMSYYKNPELQQHLNLETIANRFFNLSELVEGGCWKWKGFLSQKGYAYFGIGGSRTKGGKIELAHRWIYEQMVGPIPEGFTIDHKCKNKWCVNYDHLEAVTNQENQRRGLISKSPILMTHCKRGHEFTPENTRMTSLGSRQCLECKRLMR